MIFNTSKRTHTFHTKFADHYNTDDQQHTKVVFLAVHCHICELGNDLIRNAGFAGTANHVVAPETANQALFYNDESGYSCQAKTQAMRFNALRPRP